MTHNVATPPVVNDSSSTAAEEARTAPDPPTHPPKDRPCAAAARQGRATAVHEFGDADVILLLHLGIYMFHGPPLCRRSGAAPFDAPRSPLAEFGVGGCSFAGDPEGCCVGVDWRLGAAGVKKLY